MKVTTVFNNMKTWPVLKLWVSPETPELKQMYEEHVQKHNDHVLRDPNPNSGFDLIVVSDELFVDKVKQGKLVNHQIKAAMYDDGESDDAQPYYLYARSSIYKYPLILANSVGIIDSGYRGWLCSALRQITSEPYTLNANTKLTQLCHRSLTPFLVELVDREEDLGVTTRGHNGFGSTGI